MPKTKAHLRSSRRAPSLRDSEIDHEISLVDHAESTEEPPSPTPEIGNNIDHSTSNQPLIPSESRSPSTESLEAENAQPRNDTAESSGERDISKVSTKDVGDSVAGVTGKRPVSKENGLKVPSSNKHRSRASKEPETAIDILYENQRGGFLCGLPLFSSAALGNLDPPAWTNFAHKPSPTDIHTAQVPDPSWEWAWPDWHVNHDDAINADGDGWEYSFMFAKKFSWHGPKWYSSFVRRRAWIRQRIRKGVGYQANDPHMLNSEYFAVTPTRTETERVSINQATARISQDTSRKSRDTRRGEDDEIDAKVCLTTIDDLMTILRRTRIDREKLEAMENYIEHCSDDLQRLQDCMHEIMSLFIFQATRQLLLARLIQLHDDQVDHQHKGKSKSSTAQRKAENLAKAIKHADEEVRRLEYWSDIKGMAESGESGGAVDCDKGWDRTWEGLDKSGPRGVREEGAVL